MADLRPRQRGALLLPARQLSEPAFLAPRQTDIGQRDTAARCGIRHQPPGRNGAEHGNHPKEISVERGARVREKARTGHTFGKIIMRQRNINAETAFG